MVRLVELEVMPQALGLVYLEVQVMLIVEPVVMEEAITATCLL